MSIFKTPQIVLSSKDPSRTSEFSWTTAYPWSAGCVTTCSGCPATSSFRSWPPTTSTTPTAATTRPNKQLGFEEVFRTPSEGTPIHIDLVLDGYRIGLASEASTRDDHGIVPVVDGQRAAVILWTEDTPAAYSTLQDLGANPVKEPQPWLGRLLIAWVEDPDGHLIQVVQTVD